MARTRNKEEKDINTSRGPEGKLRRKFAKGRRSVMKKKKDASNKREDQSCSKTPKVTTGVCFVGGKGQYRK